MILVNLCIQILYRNQLFYLAKELDPILQNWLYFLHNIIEKKAQYLNSWWRVNTAGGGLPQAGAAPGYQNRGEGLLQAII